MNEALRQALARSRLTDVQAAERIGVDPKTVRRWLSGQKPYARHRWAMADLLDVAEVELWPESGKTDEPPASSLPAGIKKVYPHRWEVPQSAWRQLFESAEREIGVLVYSGLFLADDTGILRIFERKARQGVKVRILLGDPDSSNVELRGEEEGIGKCVVAKTRNALFLYRHIQGTAGIELRLHSTILYNSIYRADEQLLVNHHIYGIPASSAPVLHIDGRKYSDLASTHIESFELAWNESTNLSSVNSPYR
ncbi:XRE family transcriptional regulator [Streptomonospora halophila]|uniref:helix-turn-helix domain-containing protein n=1 Tax=Streptomonospora halophila TaxID=427369 RepID=UPI0031EBE977